MPNHLEIMPLNQPIQAAIRPPGSKSITNRALLMATLAKGNSVLNGALASDDTHVMIESLQQLGVTTQIDHDHRRLVIAGCDGNFPNSNAELYVENSGTTIRFLTAVLGIAGGNYRLDGVARMRERPIGPLVEALQHLGANVTAESLGQAPPVTIHSSRLAGGTVSIRGDLSSQYLSGLLMAAPLCAAGLAIQIEGELISKPYVQMTLNMMRDFGIRTESDPSLTRFNVKAGQSYQARTYEIEPDASAASYFWAAAAIIGGTATVLGLTEHSLQGDIRFVRVLEQMGCRVQFDADSISVSGPATRGVDVDMNDISDTVQTLAAVAPFVAGATRIRNVAHNRVKETDRIGFLAVELRKLGLHVQEHSDGLTIFPGPLHGATLETYQDHRMAMSLALIGLRVPGVTIVNPACVSKTYPDFFDDLKRFCRRH